MGRAGRAAPRTCSTLELRSHASSLTVSLPATVCKLAPASPPSPSTPVQEAPASVAPARQEWPQDVLRVVQQQMESLRSHSVQASEPGSRKRVFEASESDAKFEQQPDVSPGLEVDLLAQPALPKDWEQVLDLKTGQFYYFHWSSCKRAKQNPRELIRRADECVQAHMLHAHIRGDVLSHNVEEASSSYDDERELDSQGARLAHDASTQTNGECSETGSSEDRGTEKDGPVCASQEQEKVEINRCEGNAIQENHDAETNWCVRDTSQELKKTDAKQLGGGAGKETLTMVLGCHICSMFVMLCLSSPACPSCGANLHPDHDGIR